MAPWTFLTNHALVLSSIARNPTVTAREVAVSVGITERAVRKIIADLEAEGYITKKKEGRRVKCRINPGLSLRHHTQQETEVGSFLEVLGWRRRRRRTIKEKETD